MKKISSALLLIFSLAICYLVEFSASIFTQKSVGSWYLSLAKPSWNPPNIAFPIAWTIIYTLMGYALWRALLSKKVALLLAFFIQLIFNFLWSYLFFYLENPLLGAYCLSALFLSIIATCYLFKGVSRSAQIAFWPYILWVGYALTLNWGIVYLN